MKEAAIVCAVRCAAGRARDSVELVEFVHRELELRSSAVPKKKSAPELEQEKILDLDARRRGHHTKDERERRRGHKCPPVVNEPEPLWIAAGCFRRPFCARNAF